MHTLNNATYYRQREEHERDVAAKAVSPVVANIHLEMARRYAQLFALAVSLKDVLLLNNQYVDPN